MKRIDSILKKLSDLYEFNRKLKAFQLKKKTNKAVRQIAEKDDSH